MAAVGTNCTSLNIFFPYLRIIYFVRNVLVWPAFETEASNFTWIGKIIRKDSPLYPIIGSQLKNISSPYIHMALLNHFFNYGHSFNYCTYSFFFFIHTTHVLYYFFFSLSKLYMYVHILDAGTKELVRLFYSISFHSSLVVYRTFRREKRKQDGVFQNSE